MRFLQFSSFFITIQRPRLHSFRVPSDTREHTERRNSMPRNSEEMAKKRGRERERDGREGRVLSERRASFACGIKIRVPRYTVVLRSQTRPSGSFHVRTRREARLSASRNPFFSNLLPAERHARVYGADVAETATRASSNPSWNRESMGKASTAFDRPPLEDRQPPEMMDAWSGGSWCKDSGDSSTRPYFFFLEFGNLLVTIIWAI